ACTAVRLQDVAVEDDRVLPQRLRVDDGAQGTTDEAGDLVGAAADLALAGLAPAPGVGAAREHLVLRGDPALALALQPTRDAGLEGGGDEHPGAPELDEDRALRVVQPVPGDTHLA